MNGPGVDAEPLEARLTRAEAALGPAISAKVTQLAAELRQKIEANLSGGVLATKSGALLASLVSEIDDCGTSVIARIFAHDIAYAQIQEFGGKTAAHDIVAVKAKALAFVTGGRETIVKSVHHPGSLIPAHFYMGSALEAMRQEIADALAEEVGRLL